MYIHIAYTVHTYIHSILSVLYLEKIQSFLNFDLCIFKLNIIVTSLLSIVMKFIYQKRYSIYVNKNIFYSTTYVCM